MELRHYTIDAFTDHVFGGNPAGVCPLSAWLDDRTLQNIAQENNLSETAFFVPQGEDYHLRWFTPVTEVDLCGHATLASAFVVFKHLRPSAERVRFHTQSGVLTVTRHGERMAMNFPSRPGERIEASAALVCGLRRQPLEVYRARDLLCVFETEADVAGLVPDMHALAEVEWVIATAPGNRSEVDFVSRFFAPAIGIPEDPVTGSAHCTLIPYWASRLNRPRLVAKQISRRGGQLWCELQGDRVEIAGQAVQYQCGTIVVPDERP